MSSKRLLLLSNSKLHNQGLLEWCAYLIKPFFQKFGVRNILLIPYASVDCDKTAKDYKEAFKMLGFMLESIHEKPDPVAAVNSCECIYISGGNTFLLLKTLYEKKLIEAIQFCVIEKGIPYMGTSAGSNVATKSICTTNDMPICYPPSFEALNLVPFNINPHYTDPDPGSEHMGETREMRIQEYQCQPNSSDVLGLREGSAISVEGCSASLVGLTSAKLFQKGKDPTIFEPGDDLSFLL